MNCWLSQNDLRYTVASRPPWRTRRAARVTNQKTSWLTHCALSCSELKGGAGTLRMIQRLDLTIVDVTPRECPGISSASVDLLRRGHVLIRLSRAFNARWTNSRESSARSCADCSRCGDAGIATLGSRRWMHRLASNISQPAKAPTEQVVDRGASDTRLEADSAIRNCACFRE